MEYGVGTGSAVFIYCLPPTLPLRDCKSDGQPFHLFRLLLLYHDPGFCSFFDTMKLSPEDYLLPWVRTWQKPLTSVAVTPSLSSSVPQSLFLHLWTGCSACDVGPVFPGEGPLPCTIPSTGHDT